MTEELSLYLGRESRKERFKCENEESENVGWKKPLENVGCVDKKAFKVCEEERIG